MKLRIDAPTSDARRDRVERATFEGLAAVRLADQTDVLDRSAPRWIVGVALAAVAVAAAVVLAVVLWPSGEPGKVARAPSRVVTPLSGGSRFIVGDAVIDAGSDTSVEVTEADDGAVTLALARGSVDCDVTPRTGRPPFRVVAGEVAVDVIGTRFTVARKTELVRVDVARGKVRVTSPSGTRYVAAGDTWASEERTAVIAPPAPPDPIEPPPAKKITAPVPSPHDAFATAQRLERTDRDAAARAYRRIAAGTDQWAALALYSLAELDVARGTPTALDELDEYARRFRGGANAEDAAWLRVEATRARGAGAAVRDAAVRYLAAFPSGTYAKAAHRLVDAPR